MNVLVNLDFLEMAKSALVIIFFDCMLNRECVDV